MIYVVSGLVGTGKSYHCCGMGIDHLLDGGVVATNMSLDLKRIMDTYHRLLRPWQLVKIDAESDPRNIPRGDMRGSGRRRVMVILDEALNWFASSAGAKDERKLTWGEWLRQSDKLGQDVYFVAQTFERSAKWIRELAQVALRITNFRNFHFLRMPTLVDEPIKRRKSPTVAQVADIVQYAGTRSAEKHCQFGLIDIEGL